LISELSTLRHTAAEGHKHWLTYGKLVLEHLPKEDWKAFYKYVSSSQDKTDMYIDDGLMSVEFFRVEMMK